MRLGLDGARRDLVLAIGDLGGTALAMIDREHALDLVQLDRGGEVVPERLVPILERLGDDGDRGPRDDELAVLAGQGAPGGVRRDRHLHARVDAAEYHRLVMSRGGERRERLEPRKCREAAGPAQDVPPVEPAGQKIAAAGAASEIAQLSHVRPRVGWSAAFRDSTQDGLEANSE